MMHRPQCTRLTFVGNAEMDKCADHQVPVQLQNGFVAEDSPPNRKKHGNTSHLRNQEKIIYLETTFKTQWKNKRCKGTFLEYTVGPPHPSKCDKTL